MGRLKEIKVKSKNEIALRPSYWASVSGGKDSLFMLNIILHNPDKYPIDGVVHFELEIDYPFIKNVIDYMESECKRFGIKFVRIKPSRTWKELYNVYGFPSRIVRWSNSRYKLDAKRQLEKFLNAQGYYTVSYIGYCADEEKRFSKRSLKGRYPLVEEGIDENTILEWAKNQPIFNDYYKINRRCGCMYCPMQSYMCFAYLYKYYPENYAYMIIKMRKTEKLLEEKYHRQISVIGNNPKYNTEYLDNIIKTKWIYKLEEKLAKYV